MARLAIVVGEDIAAGLHIDDALVDVHGAARLVFQGLGHERGIAAVFECGFANGALEQEDLVCEMHRVAMDEVDFKLRRAAFLNDRIDLKVLQFREFIDIVDDLVVLVDGAEAVGLAAGPLTARTAGRRLERIVGIGVGLGKIELEFRRHDRLPAFLTVEIHDPAQDGARRDLDRVSILPGRVMDDLGSGTGGPRRRADRRKIRHHHQVALRIERLTVVLEADIVARDGLMENRDRQVDRFQLDELLDGHRLAARHSGDVRDGAIDFFDTMRADPAADALSRRSYAQDLALARSRPLVGTHDCT